MIAKIKYDPLKDTMFPDAFWELSKTLKGKSSNILCQIVFNHHRQDGKRRVPLTLEDLLNILPISRTTLLKWLNYFVKTGYIDMKNQQITLLVMTERAREDLEEN